MPNMVLSYSPSHEGGTLHLPSPTHCHRFDATSTLIQLRRSLSRSPSKSPMAYRLVTASSPNAQTPLSPSPLSPHRHVSRLQLPGIASRTDANKSSPTSTSPLGIDMPTSHRTTRASARKYSPLRATTTSRSHHLARTPAPRRVLSDASGNTVPPSVLASSSGAENVSSAPFQPSSVIQPPKIEFKGFGHDLGSSHDESKHANDNNISTAAHPFNFLSDKHPAHLSDVPVKSSPLKRIDAPSKTDPSEGSSPSAKRRSLHGTSDFDIFDQFASMQNTATGRVSPEYIPTMNLDGAHAPSPISKRTNSLRKSTLQQRHQERPSLTRAKANNNLALDFSSGTPAAPVRKGTDRNLPTRRNLFTLDFNQPPAAPAAVSNETSMEPPRAPARHPLSRTITQSSSGSEMAQDSPTHVPARAPEKKRLQGAFARSLPIGLPRNQTLARQASGGSDGSDVATPVNFKSAVPLQAPFMSTGLISKRTKHLQDEILGEQKNMPDTPCKRPMPINPMGATPAPAPRHTQLRRSQHSFGSPSTPFGGSSSRPSDGSVGKGVGIFGSSIKPLNRRGSFISVDSDDAPSGEISLSQSVEAQSTPSKDHNLKSARDVASFNPRGTIFAPGMFPSRDEFADDQEDGMDSPKCKLILSSPDGLNLDADGDSMMLQESPSAYRRFSSLGALASYSSHRRPSILKADHSPSPSPQSRKSHTLPHIRTSNLNLTDARSSVAPVSPLFERSRSPCTPADLRASVAPPDPSGLSISGMASQAVDFRKSSFAHSVGLGASMGPPATPTANRDSSRFQSHRTTQTSAHAIAEAQVDPSLTQRFDRIEMIGEGEFSSVLKVSREDEVVDPSGIAQYHGSFSTNATISPAKIPKRWVYAVKKARHPFKSRQDRLNKLKEVEVLRALGTSDHTITLQDHWEYDSYLYIQTEFCDEGSLDKFLSDAGRAARLDDFRIWKILFETGLGLKYIHDSGFIHLDLKPANILITFEGTLKIADFGMATSWPAQPGVEGEGDREYIGPEILMGKFDKPADIYALGLIMLEIAANVVLPDNGASWQRLRTGDMSDVPSLTSAPDLTVQRDASGRVIEDDELVLVRPERAERALIPMLETPPEFMASREHPNSLDNMVSWMINPDPAMRPVIDEMLGSAGVQWVAERRRAGASVYEGTWGPADEILAQDAEMMDV